MKVTITKTWETTDWVSVPDGLTKDELIQWLDKMVPEVGNDTTAATLIWTGCANENGDDICVFD